MFIFKQCATGDCFSKVIDFESAYYPNKNHGISGSADNTYISGAKWPIDLSNENVRPSGR